MEGDGNEEKSEKKPKKGAKDEGLTVDTRCWWIVTLKDTEK